MVPMAVLLPYHRRGALAADAVYCLDLPIVLIAMSPRLSVLVPRPDRQYTRRWDYATL
jgi:hypothetical protein